MAGELTVASTTDAQEELDRVAGVETEEEKPAKAAEVEEEKTEIEQTDEKKPKRGDLQSRLDHVFKQRREDRETIKRLEAKIEELAKSKAGGAETTKEATRTAETTKEATRTAETTVEKTATSGRPRPKLGETVNPKTGKVHETQEEYEDDLMDWRDEQREAKRKEEDAKSAQAKEAEKIKEGYNKAVEDFMKETDDFVDVVGKSSEIPSAAQVAIVRMRRPDIAYFLGQNPDVCRELMKMSDVEAVAEIGAIGAALEADREPEKTRELEEEEQRTSGAAKRRGPPPPIRTLSGNNTRSSVPLDELPYSEYRKIRDQQSRNRYKR